MTSTNAERNKNMNTSAKLALLALIAVLPSLISKGETSGTWGSTGSMATARYAFSGVQLRNGKVLVAGGIGATSTVLATAELYDPLTGAWTPTGSMKKARAYYTATLLPNGRVLVAGGCTSNNCSAATNTAEIYDPATGTWRAAGKMSALRYFFAATPLQNGSVLVEGGCNQGNCTTVTATAELYNPRTHQWTPTGSMHTARDYHTATLLASGGVLVTGGYTIQGASNSVEMYDPVSGTWSTMTGMLFGRALHSATALSDGRVIVAGGNVGYLPSNLTEVYNPVSNTWSPSGNLNTKRSQQSAILLRTGEPMVAGGYSYTRPYYFNVASCELYDAATNSWTLTADMTAARNSFALVLLSDGQVLGVGGLSQGSAILSSADLYTP